MTKIMQEILEEFEDKYGHLKEDGAYDELYDLFRNFLYQACTRYAEGIVPVIAKRHLINNITGRCWHCAKKNVADEDLCELNSKGKIKKELCDQILATIQEDTRPIS